MFIEDYISTVQGNLIQMGSSSKILDRFNYPVNELTVDSLYHKDPNTYMTGSIVLSGHKTVSFRSFVSFKGPAIELACHGDFDNYSFWNYEGDEDESVQKMKSRMPGSAHVRVTGTSNKIKGMLEEFLDNLSTYETHCKNLKAKTNARR